MNTVDKIKRICKERKIPLSKLEKSLGFANGYISQLRKGTVPADRLAKIAAYLEMDINEFLEPSEEMRSGSGDLTKDEAELLRLFRKLNASGKKKALEWFEDLAALEKYTSKRDASYFSSAG